MEQAQQLFMQFPELAVLTLVILIDWLLPAPNKLSIVPFFKALAEGFAKKVANKGSSQQQNLAGFLALAVYLFLILTIVLSILFVVKNDVWTQGLLLYLSLGYQGFAAQAKNIATAVEQQQKSVCKYLLSQYSPYESNKLSLLGIKKLTVETLTMRFVSLWLMPILLFIFFNGVCAFAYRAIIEAYFIWLPERKGFNSFGTGVAKIKNLLELFPTFIFAPAFSVLKTSPGWNKEFKKIKQAWLEAGVSSRNNLMWLTIVASGCRSELAGPLMLDNEKLKRPRIYQGSDVPDTAIKETISWFNRFRTIFLLFNAVVLTTLVITNR